MGKIKENETMSKNNILLIGYDSNICLGVCYCLSKVQNVNLYLLTNNSKHAGKFSRYIKKVINYSSLNLDIIRNSVVQFNINVVFPYDEEEGVFVSENKNSIETKTTKCILLTEPEKYRLGINKLKLAELLYSNNINPITFIPGTGITNFGNHTLQGTATALDRINVARLVAFIRGRLEIIGNQYLFEPNDQITRSQIGNAVTSLMIDLVAKRGIYDYLVVCDNSNNTPARIDQNQLWVDIAIEPVKAVEFIYIPLRIENTGAIAAQASA